jgi:hypothetical protein
MQDQFAVLCCALGILRSFPCVAFLLGGVKEPHFHRPQDAELKNKGVLEVWRGIF